MTNETRRLLLLEFERKQVKQKKKTIDIITYGLMLFTLFMLFIGVTDYAIISLLLSTLGLASSNTLNTRLLMIDHDHLNTALDSVLEIENAKGKNK